MKIWLASYPRSGNTYFRILLHHYTGWPTYSWKPEKIIPEGSVVGKAHQMTAYCPGEPPDDPNVIGFMKTHDYQDDEHPALLLLRDGRDAMISYAHYCKAFQPIIHRDFSNHDLVTGFLLGATGYEMWGSHTRKWMDRSPPAVILPFERLINTPPLEVLEWTFYKLGIPTPKWTTTKNPPGFKELNKINPKFFRRGTTNQWAESMTPYQLNLFQRQHIIPYNLEDEPWKMKV